jgi:ArsR family transcriptional regulator
MEDRYQIATELFHLLSHAARLQILDELRRDPACVCHLQAVIDRPQAYVSQQLGVLREAGVVTDRRDGLFVFYRLADEQVERLLEEVLGPVEERKGPLVCCCPHCEPRSS